MKDNYFSSIKELKWDKYVVAVGKFNYTAWYFCLASFSQ